MWLGWQMFPACTMPWVHSSEPHNLYIVTYKWNLGTWVEVEGPTTFKVSLGHIVNSRPAWVKWDPDRKKENNETKWKKRKEGEREGQKDRLGWETFFLSLDLFFCPSERYILGNNQELSSRDPWAWNWHSESEISLQELNYTLEGEGIENILEF